jgi:hypothetical protein
MGIHGSISRRSLLAGGMSGAAALALGQTLSGCAPPAATPPLLPLPGGTGWKNYPFVLFDNPTFTFPAIEGLTANQTDTWYVHGKVTGQVTGRDYAFLAIFAKNRIGGSIRADVYTFAVFPLDSTDYVTYTDSDLALDTPLNPAKLTSAKGYLNLGFASTAGQASWRTTVDSTNHLVPFNYQLNFCGRDAAHGRIALSATMDMQDQPSAVGAAPTQGIIAQEGQAGTGTYFQTGPAINGTMTYGGVTEPVIGSIGHIDRQFFPQYAGVDGGTYSRDHGHDWRSIHLDDNSTLDIWEQYDRVTRNSIEQFTGATRYYPATASTDFDPDVVVTPTSYVKWPSSVSNSLAPPAPNRYLTSAHLIDVAAWDLHLVGTPITAVPAHGLPVEYMSGPANFTGTIAGQPITGFGMSERTAALYRQWELVQVLSVTITNLPDEAFTSGGATKADMLVSVGQLGTSVDNATTATSNQIIANQLTPAVATLSADQQPFLTTLLKDTKNAPAS